MSKDKEKLDKLKSKLQEKLELIIGNYEPSQCILSVEGLNRSELKDKLAQSLKTINEEEQP